MAGEQSDVKSSDYKANGKPWENVKSLDELIKSEERESILKARGCAKRECPYINRHGEWFHYCGRGLPETITGAEQIPHIYVRNVGPPKLSGWCFNAFESCIFFTGKDNFPNPAEVF
jgi:hypothetical protein